MAGGVFLLVPSRPPPPGSPPPSTAPTSSTRAAGSTAPPPRPSAPSLLQSGTGVPAYAVYCFDVPTDRLAGLRLQTGRGVARSTRPSKATTIADIDLGITAADERSWPQTDDAYLAETSSRAPIELQSVTLTADRLMTHGAGGRRTGSGCLPCRSPWPRLLLASSYNVKDYWYDNGLHHELASAGQGDVRLGHRPLRRPARPDLTHLLGAPGRARVDRRLPGRGGRRARSASGGHRRRRRPSGLEGAGRPGAAGLQRLPGRRPRAAATTSTLGPFIDACTPEGRAGPHDPFTDTSERGTSPRARTGPRPGRRHRWSWCPHGRTITQVLVWWQPPDYVQLSAS